MPRIYGSKVMLREYRDSDFEHMREWVNDPDVVQTLSDIFLYPHSEKQTQSFLEMAMGPDWKGFVIANAETGDYLGQIDFVRLDLKNGWGELGLVIGKKHEYGKGYGSEALELMCRFGFDELRLNRIELSCWSFNDRARKVYERVGFQTEGVRRAKWYRSGRYFDEVCYGLLKDEWESGQ
ncbi:MAG TPA: GNAT family N-acetyltransferase [Firmicutes bacterium]|nr:GNAT family N-acetyltransferase [Bacillota bacterium]